MKHLIKGNFSASLGSDCFENLSQVKALFYLAPEKTNDEDLFSTKSVNWVARSHEQVTARKLRLIAEVETDMAGNFLCEIDPAYDGKILEIDINFGLPSLSGFSAELKFGGQYPITALCPQYAATEDTEICEAHLHYRISSDGWVALKERYFGPSFIYKPFAVFKMNMPLTSPAATKEVDFIADDWDETFENARDFTNLLTPLSLSKEFSYQMLSLPSAHLLWNLRAALLFIFT